MQQWFPARFPVVAQFRNSRHAFDQFARDNLGGGRLKGQRRQLVAPSLRPQR